MPVVGVQPMFVAEQRRDASNRDARGYHVHRLGDLQVAWHAHCQDSHLLKLQGLINILISSIHNPHFY